MIAAVALAAAIASPQNEQSGSFPGGGTYILQRDAAQPVAAIDVWYRAPAAGYDGATPGLARTTLAAIAASSPAHGTSLAELVRHLGGTLEISVYPDIAALGVSVAPSEAPAVIKALTAALFVPSITDAGFKSAQRDSAILAAENKFDSERILQDVLFEHLFSSGPQHFAPMADDAAALSQITPAKCSAYAQRAFRQPNAVVTFAGAVDPRWISAVHTGFSPDSTPPAPIDSHLAKITPQDFTFPAQVSGMGFAWAGPPIADRKAATAMDFLADYLFDARDGTVSKAIDGPGGALFTTGQFITLHDPGVLIATVSGPAGDAARQSVLAAAAAAAHPMDAAAFTAARNAFIYHILAQSQTAAADASNLGWYAAEGDAAYAPGDASGTYLALALSLDPAYVAQIAARYLQHPGIVRLLVQPNASAGPA